VITVPLPDGLGKRTVTLVSPPALGPTADHSLIPETVQTTFREVAK